MNTHLSDHFAQTTTEQREDNTYYQSRFYTIVAVITGILFTILIAITPPGADDLLFMIPAKGHEPGLGLWSTMTAQFSWIWATQSGRLGNFLSMPFLYLMPKWIFGVISGGLTTLLILLSCRLAHARRGSIVSWLIYATIVIAFPWYDYLTLVTYAINYLWAATAASGAIICFLHIRAIRGIRLVGVFILMFVAGWIHEGFGAPLTAGLTLLLIIHFKEIDRKQIAGWICTGVGTFMTVLSPMFWQRSDRDANFLLKFTYKELCMQIGPALLFVVMMIILIIWLVSRKKIKKKILMEAPFLIFFGAALASTIVFLKFYTGPRTGAPVILYSMLACGYILASTYRRRMISKSLQWTIGIIIGTFSIFHLAYADISQTYRTKEYLEATKLYEESADGIFYYDLTYPEADASLFKTSVRQFHEKVPKEFMRMYFKPDCKMVILPTAMKDFTPSAATKSEISAGAMLYNGWIVLSDTVATDSFQRIHILTEDGKYLSTRFRIDKFNCEGVGEFQLVTPHIKVLNPNIRVHDVAIYDHSR